MNAEGGPLRILYVDDDRDIRDIVQLALTLDGQIETRIFESGIDALAMLAEGAWRPDLVLLDVMMPAMDGMTVMAEMKAANDFANMPFVFITARGRDADVTRYREAGAAGIILKPFDPLALARQLRGLAASQPSS